MSAFEEILSRVCVEKSKTSDKQIRNAYAFVERLSHKKSSLSSYDYIDRATEIARTLAVIQPEETIVLAGLLHDVFRDFPEEHSSLQKTFGTPVITILEKAVRITSSAEKTSLNNPELLRNMIVTMAQDVRVILLKLSERLYEMRHLECLPFGQQQNFSQETLLIHTPIASRLGVYAMKAPLEDLSFFYLSPKEHSILSEQMFRHEHYRDRIIRSASEKIQELLHRQGIESEAVGRIKHLYSVSQKMKRKHTDSINEIYDIFAIRILVSSVSECYATLGVIHEHFIPLPNLFKDYIAVPKPNGYRSLHTTVMGLSDESRKTFPVEIQIRTKEMNWEAEFGVAAHWHYKETDKKRNTQQAVNWLETLFETGEEEKFVAIPSRTDTFVAKRIFVVTPKGDVVDLPAQATPIDFAFSIHSELGFFLRMAKVNGKIVPLDYILQSGDVVEVVTNRSATPSQSWLSMCVTSKAKNRLRNFFRARDPETLLREGRNLLNHQLVRLGHRELDPYFSALQHFRGKQLSRKKREEILMHIGSGMLSAETVAKEIIHERKKDFLKTTPSATGRVSKTAEILVSGKSDIPTKIAACCSPKPGDRILGFITRGKHVAIHKLDCKLLSRLDVSRMIDARFSGEPEKERVFLKITRSTDRVGILHDILSVFVQHNANVNDFVFRDRATILFSLEIQDFQDIFPIMNAIEKIPSITSVLHLENPSEEGHF